MQKNNKLFEDNRVNEYAIPCSKAVGSNAKKGRNNSDARYIISYRRSSKLDCRTWHIVTRPHAPDTHHLQEPHSSLSPPLTIKERNELPNRHLLPSPCNNFPLPTKSLLLLLPQHERIHKLAAGEHPSSLVYAIPVAHANTQSEAVRRPGTETVERGTR